MAWLVLPLMCLVYVAKAKGFCITENDCTDEECCVAIFTPQLYSAGKCKKLSDLGHRCSDPEAKLKYFGGKFVFHCPCQEGCSCQYDEDFQDIDDTFNPVRKLNKYCVNSTAEYGILKKPTEEKVPSHEEDDEFNVVKSRTVNFRKILQDLEAIRKQLGTKIWAGDGENRLTGNSYKASRKELKKLLKSLSSIHKQLAKEGTGRKKTESNASLGYNGSKSKFFVKDMTENTVNASTFGEYHGIAWPRIKNPQSVNTDANKGDSYKKSSVKTEGKYVKRDKVARNKGAQQKGDTMFRDKIVEEGENKLVKNKGILEKEDLMVGDSVVEAEGNQIVKNEGVQVQQEFVETGENNMLEDSFVQEENTVTKEDKGLDNRDRKKEEKPIENDDSPAKGMDREGIVQIEKDKTPRVNQEKVDRMKWKKDFERYYDENADKSARTTEAEDDFESKHEKDDELAERRDFLIYKDQEDNDEPKDKDDDKGENEDKENNGDKDNGKKEVKMKKKNKCKDKKKEDKRSPSCRKKKDKNDDKDVAETDDDEDKDHDKDTDNDRDRDGDKGKDDDKDRKDVKNEKKGKRSKVKNKNYYSSLYMTDKKVDEGKGDDKDKDEKDDDKDKKKKKVKKSKGKKKSHHSYKKNYDYEDENYDKKDEKDENDDKSDDKHSKNKKRLVGRKAISYPHHALHRKDKGAGRNKDDEEDNEKNKKKSKKSKDKNKGFRREFSLKRRVNEDDENDKTDEDSKYKNKYKISFHDHHQGQAMASKLYYDFNDHRHKLQKKFGNGDDFYDGENKNGKGKRKTLTNKAKKYMQPRLYYKTGRTLSENSNDENKSELKPSSNKEVRRPDMIRQLMKRLLMSQQRTDRMEQNKENGKIESYFEPLESFNDKFQVLNVNSVKTGSSKGSGSYQNHRSNNGVPSLDLRGDMGPSDSFIQYAEDTSAEKMMHGRTSFKQTTFDAKWPVRISDGQTRENEQDSEYMDSSYNIEVLNPLDPDCIQTEVKDQVASVKQHLIEKQELLLGSEGGFVPEGKEFFPLFKMREDVWDYARYFK